jgi:hypothetical protein
MFKHEAGNAELGLHSSLFGHDLRPPVIPAGSTVAEAIAAATRDPDLCDRVAVYVDGAEVRPEWWSRVRPSAGSRIEIRPADPASPH